MIELHHRDAQARELPLYQGRRLSQVGDHADPDSIHTHAKRDWITDIVGNAERVHMKVPDAKHLPWHDLLDRVGPGLGMRASQGPCSHVERHRPAPQATQSIAQHPRATDMIGVFVRDENRVDGRMLQPHRLEPLEDLPG